MSYVDWLYTEEEDVLYPELVDSVVDSEVDGT